MRRFALLSFGLHAGLLAAIILGFHHKESERDQAGEPGTVELMMVENQGSGPAMAPPETAPPVAAPVPPAPDVPPIPPAPPMPQPPKLTESEDALPTPPPPAPAPPPAPVARPAPPGPPSPPVQQAQAAPIIKLGGYDDETNAIVTGDQVVPASLDSKFHNREPVYPPEAARRAQQGAVTLLIHVSPQGLTSSVDVAESSGYPLLDRAARDAVTSWRFKPAVKDGQPIPFEMLMRVVFRLD